MNDKITSNNDSDPKVIDIFDTLAKMTIHFCAIFKRISCVCDIYTQIPKFLKMGARWESGQNPLPKNKPDFPGELHPDANK